MAAQPGASAGTMPAAGEEVKGGGGASRNTSSGSRTTGASLKGTSEPSPRPRILLSAKSLDLSFSQRKIAKQRQKQESIPEEQKQQQQPTHKPQQKQQRQESQLQDQGQHQIRQTGPQSKQASMSARPQSSNLAEGDYRMLRDVDRSPGELGTRNRASQSQTEAKRRSNYYEDQFAASKKEKHVLASSLTERIRSEAIVMAEVRTNVILSDEFTFITELSYNLSLRFQRPVSSIVVSIQHGVCMMFGGTFEPAYSMTIMALPQQVQPTTNKRNAALIQSHMEEVLGVPPARGLLRFVPMPEENVAVNGKTIATEITEQVREAGVEIIDDEDASTGKRRSKGLRNRLSVRQSTGNFKPSMQDITPPTSASEHAPPMPPIPSPPPDQDAHFPSGRPRSSPAGGYGPDRKARRRKSFVASIFGWPKEDETPPIPL